MHQSDYLLPYKYVVFVLNINDNLWDAVQFFKKKVNLLV